MRLLFLTLVCFCLVGPAYAAEQNALPKQFLGRWAPDSHGAGGMILDFKENGFLYEVNKDTNKITTISFFRPFLDVGETSYILVHSLMIDHTRTSFWALYLDVPSDDPSKERLNVMYANCDVEMDDFAYRSREDLKKILLTKKCMKTEPMIGGDYAGEASWVRSKSSKI